METTHNREKKRFELCDDDGRVMGFLEYALGEGSQLRAEHTVVSKKYVGRGYGSILVDTLAAYARKNQLTIEPVCPFVRSLRQRKPEKYNTTL